MRLIRLFKKDKPQLTAEMMSEDQFWSILEQTKQSGMDVDQYSEALTKNLTKLSSAEIIGFHLREQKLRYDSYTSEMWCAGYILNGGCSDDSFEYFRCWVIAHGKDNFYTALEKPDTLVVFYTTEVDDYHFEEFMYVASDAFEKNTGKDIDDFIDYKSFDYTEGRYPEMKFNWEEEDLDSMKAICPKLMEEAWR